MSIHQILHRSEALNSYLPAVLKEYKSSHGWVIEYYALQPQTQELRRIHLKINRICQRYRTKSEMRAHALSIVNNLNAKLSGGWSPFFDGEDSRLYENLPSVCDKFIAEKEKILRKNTLRSYVSVTKQLILWAKALNLPKEMQLYSLRNTGIYEMLKSGIDDLSVMQHADHSSLDITTIYANHADKNLTKIIYEKAPKF